MEINNDISVDDQILRQDGSLKTKQDANALENIDAKETYKEKVNNIDNIDKEYKEWKKKRDEEEKSFQQRRRECEADLESFVKEESQKAKLKAMQDTKEKQRDEATELAKDPTLIMLFLAFKHGYKNRMEQLKAGEDAEKDVLRTLSAGVVREGFENAKNGNPVGNLKENECFIFISRDGEKNDIKMCRTDEEVKRFIEDPSVIDLLGRSVKEEVKPVDERSISYSFISNSDKETLDKMISEKYGDINLLDDNGKGMLQNDIIKDENSTIHASVGNPSVFLKEEQMQEHSESIDLRSKEIFSEKEVLEKMKIYGFKKEDISAENMQKLKEGEKTDLMKISVRTTDTEITNLEARIRLARPSDGNTISVLHPALKKLDLSIDNFKGHTFTEEDKHNLRTTGTMGMVVNLDLQNGEKMPCLIGVDKLTNELVAINPNRLKIPDVVAGAKLDQKEKDALKEGRPVKRNDLVDKQGVQYSGWILLNPAQKTLDISSKKPPLHIDQAFTPQVKANNDGARTEELKTDKSSTMDKRQTRNNDPIAPKKEKRRGMKL